MKKLISLFLALVMMLSMATIGVVNTSALFTDYDSSDVFVVIGSTGLCGSSWNASDTSNQMTWNEEKGVYEKTYYNVPQGDYSFKVINTTTGEQYASHGKTKNEQENVIVSIENEDGVKSVTISFDGVKAQVDILSYLIADVLDRIANGEPLEPPYEVSESMLLELDKPVDVKVFPDDDLNNTDDEVDLYFFPTISGTYTLNVLGDSRCSLYNCEDSASLAHKYDYSLNSSYSITEFLQAGTKYCYEINDGYDVNVTLTLDEESTEQPTQEPTDIAKSIYIVAGDKELCGSQWDPTDRSNELTWNDEKSIYEKVYYNVAKGEYQFKITTNCSWDNHDYNLEGDASYGGKNASFIVEDDGSDVIIGFDGAKALVWVISPKDPTGDIPTEEIPQDPTQPEGSDGATIVVGGVDTQASVGDKYTYYYYLDASNVSNYGRLINVQATTYFDGSVLKVLNYEEDIESKNRKDMFPILYKKDGIFSQPISKLEADTLKFSASNLSGYGFDSDTCVLIKVDFEVIGEGATNIVTIVENSCDMDGNDIVLNSGFVGDRWNSSEVLKAVYVKPTEVPTEEPTQEPSEKPTEEPTVAPEHFYVAVGDPVIFGSNWDPSDRNNELLPNGDGTYSKVYENVVAGKYAFKVTTDGAWDIGDYNLEGDAKFGGANAVAEILYDNSTVTIGFDGTKATLVIEYIEIPTDEPTEKPTAPEVTYPLGDVNLSGAVDITDATAIQRHLADLIILSDEQMKYSDTNHNNQLDILDATKIQMLLAELITEL